jgi:hypothetical protein
MEGIPVIYKKATANCMKLNGDGEDDVIYFWIDNVHKWEITTGNWCYSPVVSQGGCLVRAINRFN